MPLVASGGTGIDPSTFWLIVSALGATVSTLASLLYKTERDARIKAEKSLEQFQLIAPDLAENVRWLVEEAQDHHADEMPWPSNRNQPQRTTRSRTRRR